ncbi:zinc transport system permease protein [Jannaschia faecimaris]|uniref:High-affinity zinc uptake system membrane protein ZnuB n=2 Tax=Jannaschia faecimaris TaxID=1244108 RepID=A0A1H3U2P9_9RHOB|nr:zinc transport system permease protein [Jannaschia faecimaris]
MLLDSFLVRAALAGIGIAMAAGPLGCFIIWRRMAYFSDATAHASILGVALALAFDAPIFGGALAIAFLMALAVTTLTERGGTTDTTLGVLSYSALAIGLVAVSMMPGVRLDLFGYLFGDILTVTRWDVVLIWIGAIIVAGLLAWRWSRLLISTMGPDLAFASGVNPRREQLILTVALAIVVACGLKVLGALLVGALLLIPAATARTFTRTPERMAVLAACLGAGAAGLGVVAARHLDTPAGPTIVCVATAGFLVGQVARLRG